MLVTLLDLWLLLRPRALSYGRFNAHRCKTMMLHVANRYLWRKLSFNKNEAHVRM